MRPLHFSRSVTAGRPCRLTPFLAMVVTAASMAPQAAAGAAWDMVPSAAAGLLYESNPRGATDESDLRDDAYGAAGWLQLDISGDARTSRIDFRPKAEGAAYDGTPRSSDLNYFNFYLPVAATWSSELAQYRVTGGFEKRSTRNFPSADPNQDPTINPRFPFDDEYSEQWSFNPTAIWQLDPRNSLNVSIALDDIEFTEARITQRFNYQTALASANWTHVLGAQHRISVGANVNGFFAEIPGLIIENDTVSYGGDVGYQYLLSESTSVGLSAGAAHSELKVKGLPTINTPEFGPLPCLDPVSNTFVPCEVKSDDENFIGRVFWQQRSAETITTEFSASRSIQPSSDGAQVTLDTIRGFVSKDFTALVAGSIGATFTKQDAIGAEDAQGRVGQRFKREYWSAEAALNWKLSRHWVIRLDYSYYLDQATEGFTYEVPRHRANVYLQYFGQKRY